MTKINKHIEIVSSSSGVLSSMSRKSYDMVQAALSNYYEHVGVSLVSTEEDLERLVQKKPDLVFLGAKRIPKNGSSDQFIWLSDFLDGKGIPYTGSAAHAHKLDHYKDRAKSAVKNAGLTTSDYFMASKGEFAEESQLPLDFPLFVKPPHLGGGFGIDQHSVVRNFGEFTKKVASLHDEFHSHSLVEKYLGGREFTVAILQSTDRSHLHVLPIEMLPKKNLLGDRVIDHAMKSSKEETAVAMVADGAIKTSVEDLAKAVFIAIGGRDYGRIDIRLDENNVPYFLEANLIPSIINGSGNFQKACLINLDLSYEAMLLQIVELAFTRTSAKRVLAVV
jgi:D-alanine-D-alanine ligase